MTDANDLAGWPKEGECFICTAERPMPMPAPGGAWLHPEAKCVGGCSEGCCDDYRCPACGVKWRSELPQ